MSQYRVYFNRHADHPFIWSVDQGDLSTEQKVVDIKIHGSEAYTGYDPNVPPGDMERPRVFFTIYRAVLVVKDNVAHFYEDYSADTL